MSNDKMHVRHSDFDCIHAVYAEQGGGRYPHSLSHPHKFNEWGYKSFSLMKVHQRFIDEPCEVPDHHRQSSVTTEIEQKCLG